MSRYYRLIYTVVILAGLLLVPSWNASAASPVSLATTPTPTPPNCILVQRALSQGLIQLTLSGNGNLFYKNPLHYQIVNLTARLLSICFPAGLVNNPGDSSYQSLMLVKTVIIDLAANATQEGDLFADCINETKHAPSQGLDYHLGKMATGSLLSLAQTIDAQSVQGHLGAELAIWAITDQYSLNSLNATPDPNQPSLMDSIRPLFCLAQDDVNLGQQLLQTAQTGVSLYQGDNPLTSYCQSQGIPSVSQIVQRAKVLGIEALVVIGAGVLGCIIVVILLIWLAICLFRKRK